MCAPSYASSAQIAKLKSRLRSRAHFSVYANALGRTTQKPRNRWNENFHGYDVQSCVALASTALLFLSNLIFSVFAYDNSIGARLVVSSSGVVSRVTQQSAAMNIRASLRNIFDASVECD